MNNETKPSEEQVIKLNHAAINIIPDYDEIFVVDNEWGYITTVNAFCNRLNVVADIHRDSPNTVYDEDDNFIDNIDKIPQEEFKGNLFEMFAEYLIRTNASDNRIGIYDYIPVKVEDDVGVDGIGIGENTKPATVQVKFRRGDYKLAGGKGNDKLTNFTSSSVLGYGVDPNDDKNMLIITSGHSVYRPYMDNVLYNKVRVLGRDQLREMLDNRPMWWKGFWDSLKHSQQQRVDIDKKVLREHQQEALNAIIKVR